MVLVAVALALGGTACGDDKADPELPEVETDVDLPETETEVEIPGVDEPELEVD